MKKKPDYIDDAAPIEPDENAINNLALLVDTVADLQKRKDELNGEIKKLNSKILEGEELAVELMEDAGLSEFVTDTGHEAAKKEFRTAKINDNAVFLAELKERGEEGLAQIGISGTLYDDFAKFFKRLHKRELDANEVKLQVHYQSLQAYVRERGAEDEPKGLEINRFLTVKIKRKK